MRKNAHFGIFDITYYRSEQLTAGTHYKHQVYKGKKTQALNNMFTRFDVANIVLHWPTKYWYNQPIMNIQVTCYQQLVFSMILLSTLSSVDQKISSFFVHY